MRVTGARQGTNIPVDWLEPSLGDATANHASPRREWRLQPARAQYQATGTARALQQCLVEFRRIIIKGLGCWMHPPARCYYGHYYVDVAALS